MTSSATVAIGLVLIAGGVATGGKLAASAVPDPAGQPSAALSANASRAGLALESARTASGVLEVTARSAAPRHAIGPQSGSAIVTLLGGEKGWRTPHTVTILDAEGRPAVIQRWDPESHTGVGWQADDVHGAVMGEYIGSPVLDGAFFSGTASTR